MEVRESVRKRPLSVAWVGRVSFYLGEECFDLLQDVFCIVASGSTGPWEIASMDCHDVRQATSTREFGPAHDVRRWAYGEEGT